jgi:hypothetical protein
MYIRRHVKYQLFLSDFNETWDFLDRFSKNPQISNLTENPSSRSRVFTFWQTEMTKLTDALRSSANAPKMWFLPT